MFVSFRCYLSFPIRNMQTHHEIIPTLLLDPTQTKNIKSLNPRARDPNLVVSEHVQEARKLKFGPVPSLPVMAKLVYAL